MKNKKYLRLTGIIALLVVVFIGGYFGVKYIVYGEENTDAYVTGDPMDVDVVLTSQNDTTALAIRPDVTPTPAVPSATPVISVSGGAVTAEPTVTPVPTPAGTPIPLPEMPQCIGGRETKYSEENPFMVLEVVPDLSEQVLAWMDADSVPISDFELSRRLSMVAKDCITNVYRNASSDAEPLFKYTNFKVWNTKIDVDDITLGGDDMSIRQKVEQISNDDSLSERARKTKIEEYVEKKCYITRPFYSVEEKFKVESADGLGQGADFAGIDEKYFKDKYNWVSESTNNTKKKSGYLVKTGSVKGALAPDTGNKTVSIAQNAGDSRFCWSFTSEKPNGQCVDDNIARDQNYLNNAGNIPMGSYMTITDWNMPVIKYTYYNLVNNDLLKDALLNPYDDVNHTALKTSTQIEEELKHKFIVITTKASQVNELAKYDTPQTLDYIERCDMLYLNSLNPNTDAQQFHVTKFYSSYVDSYRETVNPDGTITATATPDADKEITQSQYPSYRVDGDLEWSVCMKIINKLSTYVDFPMLINSTLYNICSTESISNRIYKDQNNTWQSASAAASLTNTAKIFHIASEFNLLARKTALPELLTDDEKDTYKNFFKNIRGTYNDEGLYQGERTFMDDIYPNIKQIKLATPNGNCEYTGYYERPETDAKSKNCFLWSEYTFYPVNVQYNKQKKDNDGVVVDDGDSKITLMQSAGSTLEMQTQLGYLETFAFNEGSGSFTTETNATNRDKFYGTDADRSTVEKHYQNVVGQPVNQSLFTTDGMPFWKIFSSLREIVIKPKISASDLIVKIKKVNFSTDKYIKYIDVNEDAPNDYDDNDIIDIQFTVKNPAGNDNDGYFYVHKVNDNGVKRGQYYEKSKSTSNEYIQDDDCLIQEITTSTGANVTEETINDNYTDSMVGYKVPAGETLKFRLAYKIKDYLGTSSYPDCTDGTKYQELLFSTRVVRYKRQSGDPTKILEWSMPNTSYTKLLFRPIDLFNLE